jgi:hypothetical protein
MQINQIINFSNPSIWQIDVCDVQVTTDQYQERGILDVNNTYKYLPMSPGTVLFSIKGLDTTQIFQFVYCKNCFITKYVMLCKRQQ